MRIISGCLKGRKLCPPRSGGMRPTSDRVREAVFNILGPAIEDAFVLDLFAGTGAYGIEALSRGAAFAVLADINRAAVEHIRRAVSEFKLETCARVMHRDASHAVTELAEEGAAFDFVFLDPPYSYDIGGLVLAHKDFSAIVKPEGVVITETGSAGFEPASSPVFKVTKHKKYGDTAIAVLERE